jgi:hypothetical protein
VGSLKKQKNQEFSEVRMANQKVRAKYKVETNQTFCFEGILYNCQIKKIRALILNLKNKD